MIINHNISSLNAQRQLGVTDFSMNKSLERLSSGLRINRAGDDAAGLAISEKMRGQINGLNQAVRNAQDAISLIQTAEGALNETHSILQRMRELSVQASNDTNVTADRNAIKTEINELQSELNRIAKTTEFNTQKLLSGGFSAKTFLIGANSGQTIKITITNVTASALGVSGTLSVSNTTKAQAAITSVNTAIATVSTMRSKLGAWQNRLEHTIANLNVASENLQAAESRVRDVDMASEMSSFTRSQILSQAGTSMLAQANQKPQGVLSLLR
ncbi:flagellin [Heliobacterium gestii]|uniref:Flagellin n=1 Tax=Heliomicrobium gestii TaxID=2699 RepID=A0A845L8H5_HELGE|nr:flagellin [Heliomicrobium gestii]MBM7866673.1 flagellin [Heliomicrobium gestii]MZP43047.1 flagellin [Heliomicrobium gestii]